MPIMIKTIKKNSPLGGWGAKFLIISALALPLTGASAQSLLPYQDESLSLDVRVKDALSRMTLKEKCRLSYAQSKFKPRLRATGHP